MKNIITIFTLFVAQSLVFGQVAIDMNTTETQPHEYAILDIKADSKGVIFPKVADHTQFPFYNANEEDLYDDHPEAKGSIIYNQEDNEYYKYDGTTWTKAKELSAIYDPRITRTANNEKKLNFTYVWGIAGSYSVKLVPITNNINFSKLLVNNLDLEVDENEHYITIKEDGLYNVTGIIGFNGTTALGLADDVIYQNSLEVKYPGSNNWITFAYKKTQQGAGLLFDIGDITGRDKSSSVFTTAFLPAGAKIRMTTFLRLATAVNLALAVYNSSNDHRETFISIIKIK